MYIYAYKCIYKELEGLLKIGQTNRPPHKRVKEQIGQLPILNGVEPFKLVFQISDKDYGANLTDKEIHKALKPYHVSKEWFRITVEELETVILGISYDKSLQGQEYIEGIVSNNTGYIVTYNGITYNSLMELAKAVEINYQTLSHRLNTKHMTLEQAIETPIDISRRHKGVTYKAVTHKAVTHKGVTYKAVTYNGVTYNSLRELAKAIGINYDTLKGRIHKGMTLEQAVETPVINRKASYVITYNGVTYNSLRELAKAIGINYNTLFSRIRKGKTLNR